MLSYLYQFFLYVITRMGHYWRAALVTAGIPSQPDLRDRLYMTLEKMPPKQVQWCGCQWTNEQRIQNFRTLPADHPRVFRALKLFQLQIDCNLVKEDGSMIPGHALDLICSIPCECKIVFG